MARESQSLQIASIVFAMLAVVLGVSTFIYHGRCDEALKAAQEAETKAAETRSELDAKDADCNELKRILGSSQRSLSDIKEQFAADMQKYGANYPDDARFYGPMIARLSEAVDGKSKEVKALKANLQDLDARFAERESIKDAAIKKIQDEMTNDRERINAIIADYVNQRHGKDAQEDLFLHKITEIHVAANERSQAAAEAAKAATNRVKQLTDEIARLNGIIRKFERPDIENSAGTIVNVNPRTATVWINLGRADSLERQTSFTVYSADSSEIGKAVKKATIEVTKVLEDHLSEAKILDDKITDPIMPGDKINTPFWSPGEKRHFALAGFMDIDGDGRDAIGTVGNLITSNGGAVDAIFDGKGARTGTMDARTQYIVVGTPLNARSSPELIKQYTQMLSDADRLGIKKMSLADFKTMVGYIRTNTVEQFEPRGGTVRQSSPAQESGTRAEPQSAASPGQ